MKILILGGTRFLGYHITRRLLRDGHEVSLFNRGITPDDFGPEVRRFHGDRYDNQTFFGQLRDEKFDVVLDLIAFKAEDSQLVIKTFQDRIKHFIHISTGAVYIVTKDFPCPLHEEDFDREIYPKPKKDDGLWTYGFHKRKCEEVLREAYEKQNFPVTIFRLPIVIGEKDYTLRAYSYFLRIEDGNPLILPDSGMNVTTHIYQDDIARTLSSNLLNSVSMGQAYNLAQEEIITLRSFVMKAGEILGRKVKLLDIPSNLLRKCGLGIDFSPFSNRRPFIMDVQKAKKDLNFSSTPFDTWMRKTIHWFIEEYRGGPPDNYALREKEIEFIQRYQKAIDSIV